MENEKSLVRKLVALHEQGSLHVMDGGNICVGCGQQWPCRTIRIINVWALEQVLGGDE